jgi:hypothetical protein
VPKLSSAGMVSSRLSEIHCTSCYRSDVCFQDISGQGFNQRYDFVSRVILLVCVFSLCSMNII